MRQQALNQVQVDKPMPFYHMENGRMQYTIFASSLDVHDREMRNVALTWYEDGKPAILLWVPMAFWNEAQGRWIFKGGATAHVVKDGAPGISFSPHSTESVIDSNCYAMRLKASPF